MPALRLLGRQTTAQKSVSSSEAPNHLHGARIRSVALIVSCSGSPPSHKGACGPVDQPWA